MANYQSSFDFILSAGVDTSSIKQDILKAYNDAQVDINGKKITISNIVIDSKNALDSFKKQMNNISLSNGIKIEIDTESFREARSKIEELQSLLDKTSLKSINSMFQKDNRDETFKSLIKDIQITDNELSKLNTKAETLFANFGKKKDQGNPIALKNFQEEYVVNQKLYQVMQQQIGALKEMQSVDGWSDDVNSLSEAYKLLKSIETISVRLKSTKYSNEFAVNTNNISSLDLKGISEKYGSLANNLNALIRGQEATLRTELNNLIESWMSGTSQINDNPIVPDIKTEDVKARIAELQTILSGLQSKLDMAVLNIANAEQGVKEGMPNAENVLNNARKKFDELSASIKATTAEITDLKIQSSDFSGVSNTDLQGQFEKASTSAKTLAKQIELLDASKIDISGLSDDDILNRIKDVNNELNTLLSLAKTSAQKGEVTRSNEYRGLLAQFKTLYEYAQSHQLDVTQAGLSKEVLKGRVAQIQQINTFNEDIYNDLVRQRGEQQEIVNKCQEELNLRQRISDERPKTEGTATSTQTAKPSTQSTTTPPTAVAANGDNIGSEDNKGLIQKEIKLIPDASTFKTDSETELSKIPLEKDVKLNVAEVDVGQTSGEHQQVLAEATSFDTVKQAVLKLKQAIEAKIQSITNEKIAMDTAAQSEVQSVQSIIDKIDELNKKILGLADLKISIVGVENLDSIDGLDLQKLQVPESSLNSLSSLSYVLETIKALIVDIRNLKLSDGLGKDTLSGIKFTKENAEALESAANSLPTLDNVLNGLGTVGDTVKNVEELTKKIAILKGVVDNIKDIKVEFIENTTTGKTKTKVGKNTNVDNLKNQSLGFDEVKRVLSQTEECYDDIVKVAREANPALSETVKVVQRLRLQDDGRYAQSFTVTDDKGDSAVVNKDGKFYLGSNVVKDDIAAAKREQKELNAAAKEYQDLINRNAKTKESNANYLLTEQLKSMEKIAKLKAEIISRESQGKPITVLQEKLQNEKEYCNALAKEMEYYKGTQAYQERISALRGKAKETSLIVEDAKALAKHKQEESAAKSELSVQQQLTKELEAQANAQYKKGQAFLKEQQDYLTGQFEADAIERNKRANQELIDTIHQYSEVKKRIANEKAFDGDVELAEKLETKISELQKQPILSESQFEESERKLKQLFDELDTIEKKIKQVRKEEDEALQKQLAREAEKQSKDQYKRGQAFLDEQQSYLSGQFETDAIKRNKDANQELIDTIEEYGKVAKRIAKNEVLAGDIELAEKLEDKILELQKQPILSLSQIEESERKLEKLYDTLDVIERQTQKRNDESKKKQDAKDAANQSKVTEAAIKAEEKAIEAQLAQETALRNKQNKKKWKDFEKEQKDYLEMQRKVNAAISETDEELNNLSLHENLDDQFLGLLSNVDELNTKLKNESISVSEYRDTIKELVAEYSNLVAIQQKRDYETYQKAAQAAEAETKATEAQKKRAREVADAQLKYEQNLIKQKEEANKSYIDWWDKKSKETNSDYTELGRVLDQINKLEIKKSDSGLSPKEQDDLNVLLAKELELRKKIAEHGIVDSDADQRVETRDKALQLEKLSALYDQAIAKLEDIHALQVKDAKGKITQDEQAELNVLLGEQVNIEAQIAAYKKNNVELTKRAAELEQKRTNLQTDLQNINGGKVYESGNKQKNNYNKAKDVNADLYIPSVSSQISQAQKKITETYNKINDGSKRTQVEIDKLNKEFEEQFEIIKKLSSNKGNLLNNEGLLYLGGNFTGNIQQNKDAIISYLNTLDMGEVAFDTFTRGHKSMIVAIKTRDNQIKKYEISLNDTTNAVYGLYKSEKAYTSFGQKWMAGLKSKFVSLTQYITGIELLMRGWTELQRGFETIRELDVALTEMRKVSDESISSLKNFQDVSFDLAESVGATASTIQNSTADFMRLGESLEDAAESAQTANILLNVSEFESIDEATESLVAMSQAYQELEKIDIVDVLNNIGNNYSISTDGLATALQKSASALKTANNDLNEAVALTTAGNAVAQDPDSVGAGLRTISLRLVGTEAAKEELKALGEETDDVITTVSKLREKIISATKAATKDGKGFDILDENGNYKSTYEIMQGLADLYDDIVAKDKELGTNNLNLLLETIAGKNRSNIAASILQNGEMLRSVYEDAQESEGSAQKELDKYLDSIEGKISKLTNNVQEFWHTAINSDLVKNGIDLLSKLVKVATELVDTFGLLPPILGTVFGYFKLKNWANVKGGGRAKNAIEVILL